MSRQQFSRHAPKAWSSVVLVAALLTPAVGGNESELGTKAVTIRASADRLAKVQRIPWITDVEEGFRLAKEEKRPIFLYVITGDPLGDC